MAELITISIPTYRRPTMLLHCLHSCFTQDYRPLDIDISDNSPNDETEVFLRSVTPPDGVNIRYWRSTEPAQLPDSLNKLFDAARGRRLVMQHDDDCLVPGAVSAMAAGFDQAPDVIAAYGQQDVFNSNGERLDEYSRLNNAWNARTPDNAGLTREPLVCAFLGQPPASSILLSTEACRKVRWRDFSEVGLLSDIEFYIRLALAYRDSAFVLLPQVTGLRREDHDNLSATRRNMAWRLYDFAARLDGLSPAEEQARETLLQKLAPQVVVDHALDGRRREALRVFSSRHYPRAANMRKSAFHLGLIAVPQAFPFAMTLRRAV